MVQPGRSYANGSAKYRYGFNGKENDNEVKGEGNQQDYGQRIYDPRVGRFLSVDPISVKYPELTPYQFASNRPIDGIDQDGLEFMPGLYDYKNALYVSQLVVPTKEKLSQKQIETLGNAMNKGQQQGYLLGLGLSVDIYTGGKITTFLMASEGFSVFQDNRAKTQKGRIEQDKRSKVALANTLISYTTSKLVGITASAVKELAFLSEKRLALASNWMGSADKAKYVDLTKPVFTEVIEPGTKLIQYRVSGQEGYIGNFYALPGTKPEQIGLDPNDVVKVLEIIVDKRTTVLISTHAKDATYYANPSVKVEGGGSQIFSPQLKKNIKVSNGN